MVFFLRKERKDDGVAAAAAAAAVAAASDVLVVDVFRSSWSSFCSCNRDSFLSSAFFRWKGKNELLSIKEFDKRELIFPKISQFFVSNLES